jgi:uncharacterized YigZ family protein
MDEKHTYRTIQTETKAEFKDRGSKFIAFAFPVCDEENIKAKLKEIKEQHPKAVHYCYAYRIGISGNQFRVNDDGEPSGSAGRPILGQLDSVGLTNVFVVVVRYFGGTLLGVPGLINAYKTATAAALQTAAIIEKDSTLNATLSFEYPAMNEVKYLLKKAEASILHQELMQDCKLLVAIPTKNADLYLQRLSEIRGLKIDVEK